MQTAEFFEEVEKNLIEHITFEEMITEEGLEVIPVWYSKSIQNHKGLFIVRNNNINKIYNNYFECTYNGDEKEMYIDCYCKYWKQTKKY